MPEQYVLLLGASQDQRFIIRTARQMGLGTVVVDGNPDSVAFPDADIFGVVSTRDPRAIIVFAESQMASGISLAGVSVMGSDIPHIVSAVAQHFGWIGPAAETARLATDKFAMKERFRECGIPIPPYALVDSPQEVREHWNSWGCQSVVIKPVDQAGSRGVRKLTREAHIEDAFAHAQSNSAHGGVILEAFIPGPQISTESILTAARCETPGFADRLYEGMEAFLPQILENGGWVPSFVDKQTETAVKQLVENAARALGIQYGVAKGDVVISPSQGPMMIEMAARLSGGDFSESLVPMGFGINYVEAALRIAMGQEPQWEKLQPTKSEVVVNRYLFCPPGQLDAIEGIPEVQSWSETRKLELWVREDGLLPEIRSHGARSGVFILSGPSREAVQTLVDRAYATLKFRIDGRWVSGDPRHYPAEIQV